MVKSKFKLWSQINLNSKEQLTPDLGMVEWNDLTAEDKNKIWLYLKNKEWFVRSYHVYNVVFQFNNKYKKQSFGAKTLIHGGPHIQYQKIQNCCMNISIEDFQNIFMNRSEDIVFELISIFGLYTINHDSLEAADGEEDESEVNRLVKRAWYKFDKFKNDLNDIFEQFSINIVLTRNGLVFRQDSEITEGIYQPVLSYLSNIKWKEVNRDLSDAFSEFQKKTPQGYSACITHNVSALQAFMQILVNGKTGKGNLEGHITLALKEDIIPNDPFSNRIFKDIESILMAERQKSGNPHPKKEYANEKNAKLLLNLTMVFIQHCIVE